MTDTFDDTGEQNAGHAVTAPSPALMPRTVTSPADAPTDPAPADTEPDDPDDDFTDMRRARAIRSENKTLRTRAKQAETELAELRATVDNYWRADVEAIVAGELRDVRDLLDRHPVTEFLADDGAVDTEAVHAAVAALVADRPHLAADRPVTPPPTNRPIESLRAGASPEHSPAPTTWRTAIRGGF